MLPAVRRAAAALAALAVLAPVAAAAVELPGPVVQPAWLAGHRDAVQVLDVRVDAAGFTVDGHIPDAVLVRADDLRTTRTRQGRQDKRMLPGPETFRTRARGWGLTPDQPVVVAPSGKSPRALADATYLYWALRHYGHESVALLAGGTAAWKAAGHDTSRKVVLPRPTDYKVGEAGGTVLATTEDVAAIVEDGRGRLVDARPLPYYVGLRKKPWVARAGHLPDAVHLPYTLLTRNGGSSRLRDGATLDRVARVMDVPRDASPLVVYGNSGRVASLVWFVLSELLDHRDTRLYDGGMHAWAKAAGRPVVNPVRDATP